MHRHLLASVVENDEHMKAPCSFVVIAPAVQLIVFISLLTK